MTQQHLRGPLIRIECLLCGAQHVVYAPVRTTGEQFVLYPPCDCPKDEGAWAVGPAEADA